MKPSLAAALVLASAASTACGPPAPPGNPVVAIGSAQPTATAAPTVAPAAEPAGTGEIPMYPVAQIYSLIDLTATEGGIELRVGYDPGGGQLGAFRYVPLVNGLPDFDQETSQILHANTSAAGYVSLAGKRPDLLLHIVSAFRSAASDSYQTLGANDKWGSSDVSVVPGIGLGIYRWSNDRLLEWRGTELAAETEPADSHLPRLRVISGKDREAPSLPGAIRTRMKKEGYNLQAFTVLRTGEVIAVGRLSKAKGFGTALWKDDVKQPQYFVTDSEVLKDDWEVEILGGDSLAGVRLLANDHVMKLDGSAWVVESTVPADGLPDVWFGTTLARWSKGTLFARFAAGSPWRPLQMFATTQGPENTSFAVDAAGVIWKNEDEILLSNKQPDKPKQDISEDVIVSHRKASILRGGSTDATGAPPDSGSSSKCRMSYVLLDQAPQQAADKNDYPAIRQALKGHPEFAKAKLVVSVEKGIQFFGALLADENLASDLEKLVKKSVKPSHADKLCAEPVVVREIKIDFTTGDVVK